ncbi:MAG TPA: LppP/LprE family lipoprotein [Conexibacter sp.]|nr:LppP/LprE family lipoprotein [Conexibacter sp.]
MHDEGLFVPSRRRIPPALPLAALALVAIAGCGGGDSPSAELTRTTTVTRTITAPATTPTTTTPTTPTTTTPSTPLTLQAAEQVLDGRGYATLTERDWQPDHTLKVLIGIRRAQPRAELAFFFAGEAFIGTDTKEPSGAIEVTNQADDRITLGYGLYEPGDALCCARGGTRHVTYVWDGARLTPEDPIPSADPGAAQSRR